ncbi:hypothetical protein DFH09DRAFT_1091329 [Mycena vulgaris]|nr:hypothetical protein DFH09DRAFT_1091329 [Mycena vulgaris]
MGKAKTAGSPKVTGKRKAEQPEPESESEGSVAGSVDSRATATRGAPGSRRSARGAVSGAPSASSTPVRPKPKSRKRPNTGAAAEPDTPAAPPSTPKVGPPRGLKRADALPSIPSASSSSTPAALPALSIKVKLPATRAVTPPTGTITVPRTPVKTKRAPSKPLDPSRSFLRKPIPSDRGVFPSSFVLQGANDEAINFEVDVVPGPVTIRPLRGKRSNEELDEFYGAQIDSSKPFRAVPVAEFAGDWRSSEMGTIVDEALEMGTAAAAHDAVRFRLECLEEFFNLYPVINPYSAPLPLFDDPSFDDPRDPRPARPAHPYNPPVPKFDPSRSDTDVSADAQNFQTEASEYAAWWAAEGARLERVYQADLAGWRARRQLVVDRATKRISSRTEQVRLYIERRQTTFLRHFSVIRSLGEYAYILGVGPEHFFSEHAPRHLPPSPLPADISSSNVLLPSSSPLTPSASQAEGQPASRGRAATPASPSPFCQSPGRRDASPAESVHSRTLTSIDALPEDALDPFNDEADSEGQSSVDELADPAPVDKGKGRDFGAGENEAGGSEPEVVPSSVLGEEELPPRAVKVAGMKKSSKRKRSKPKTKADIVLELPADPESKALPLLLVPYDREFHEREFFGEGAPLREITGLYTSDNVPRGLTPYNGGGYTLSTRPGLEHCIAGLEDAGISPSMVGPVAYVTRGKGCSECWSPGWWCLRPRQGYEMNAKCIRCLALRKACSQLDGYNFQVVDRRSLELNLKLFVEVLVTHGWVFTQVLKQNTFELMLRAALQVRRYGPPSDAKEKPVTVPLVLDGTPEEIREVVKAETLEVLPAFLLGIDVMRPTGSSQEALRAVFAGVLDAVDDFGDFLRGQINDMDRSFMAENSSDARGSASGRSGAGSAGTERDADVTMVGGEVNDLEATFSRLAQQDAFRQLDFGSLGQMPRPPPQLSHGFGPSAPPTSESQELKFGAPVLLGGSAPSGSRPPQAPPSTSRAPKSSGPKSSIPPP